MWDDDWLTNSYSTLANQRQCSLYTQTTQAHSSLTHNAMVSPEGKLVFSKWKYRHDFSLLEVKDKNVHVNVHYVPEQSVCPRPLSAALI